MHKIGLGHRIGLGCAALLLAGCGVDPDAVPPGEQAPAETAPATLDLEAAGIIVPPQNGFEQLAVPFGSSRLGTEATLTNLLGDPVSTSDSTGDCPLSLIEYQGLTISFDDAGEFVGYYATAPFVPDETRAQMLEDEQVALQPESSISEAFTIGAEESETIAGRFAGPGDDAAVEALWAGENCIFQ